MNLTAREILRQPPRLYAVQREEDLPFAFTGMILALQLVFHRELHVQQYTADLVIIGLIILFRIIVRRYRMLFQFGIWSICRMFSRELILKDKDILVIDIQRKWLFRRLVIAHNRDDRLQILSIPLWAFDVAPLIRDTKRESPGKVGRGAEEYLEDREQRRRSGRAVTFGVAALLSSALYFILAVILARDPVSPAMLFRLSTLYNPILVLGVLSIILFVRLVRIFRVRFSEMWGTLLILLLVRLFDSWVAARMTEFYVPGGVTGITLGLASGLLVLALRSFFATGLRASLVASVVAAGCVAAGPSVVADDPTDVVSTFGVVGGPVYDLGWEPYDRREYFWVFSGGAEIVNAV